MPKILLIAVVASIFHGLEKVKTYL